MPRLLLACALLASPPLARAELPADAKKVIDAAVTAYGGADALKKAKAGEAKMEGTMMVQGGELKYAATAAYVLPDRFRLAFDTELLGMKSKVVQVVNGDKAKTEINDTVQKVSDADRTELKAALALQKVVVLLPLLDEKEKFAVKALPDDDTFKVLSVTPDGGKEVKVYFDAKYLIAKLTRKATINGRELDEVQTFSDYKAVEGVMNPHKLVVTHDGKPFMTSKVTELKYTEKVDDKKFAAE